MDLAELTIDVGDGVAMRLVRESDADAVLDLVTRNFEHLRTFMEWAKPDYSRADADAWIAGTWRQTADESVNLGIFRDERMIGTIGFASFDNDAKVAEIGYWIDAAEQGKGIIGQATAKMLELAFDTLGMNRVQIRCASGNVRSATIPRKFGFVEEGRQRQHVMRDGKVYDFLIFGLLREEWSSRRNAEGVTLTA